MPGGVAYFLSLKMMPASLLYHICCLAMLPELKLATVKLKSPMVMWWGTSVRLDTELSFTMFQTLVLAVPCLLCAIKMMTSKSSCIGKLYISVSCQLSQFETIDELVMFCLLSYTFTIYTVYSICRGFWNPELNKGSLGGEFAIDFYEYISMKCRIRYQLISIVYIVLHSVMWYEEMCCM